MNLVTWVGLILELLEDISSWAFLIILLGEIETVNPLKAVVGVEATVKVVDIVVDLAGWWRRGCALCWTHGEKTFITGEKYNKRSRCLSCCSSCLHSNQAKSETEEAG